ncbi:MAG TPA: glycosyltransferase [Candidatus Limnocylindrales bacterium]|nr:glycosyltransferase [Candidatus Limnocylindrales bacterium]
MTDPAGLTVEPGAGARSVEPGPGAPHAVVVAFVLNDATMDSRVLRSAATLAEAGHHVTLIARTTDPYAPAPAEAAVDGVTIVRLPVARGPLRWLLLARRPRALLGTVIAAARRRPLAAAALAPVALVAAPVVAILAALLGIAARAGSAARGARLVRAGWLLVSWRLQWRFGVRPWARAAAEAAERVARAAGDERTLVLHGHDLRGLAAAVAARERIGRGEIIYDSHEIFTEAGEHAERPAPARRALRALERRLATSAVALVTVNEALAERLGPALGVERVVVVHNCPPRWSPPADGENRLRAATGIPAGAPILLYHGGLAPGRGIDTLLAAIREPGLEDSHLVFLGFGPWAARVRALAADRSRAGRVHALPPVPPDELLDWVAGADVAVAPIEPTTLNHRLSTPNKVFEALAAGVPVVASDFPQLRAIVDGVGDGPLGAVADPRDAPAVATAVRSILDAEAPVRTALRARCLAAAHARWNWETESSGLVALVGDLAGRAATIVPQRVTFVLPSTGEFDARTRRFAASLGARGHAVTILARSGDGLPDRESVAGGARLIRVAAGDSGDSPAAHPRPTRTPIAEARRILAVARRAGRQARAAEAVDTGADLYHAMGFLALPVASRLAASRGSPFIYDARDLYVESNNIARLPAPARWLFTQRERAWARRAAAVLTVNESCADYLERRLGVPRPAVVMNGQPDWTPPDPWPDLLRERLDLPPDRRVVLYHGGFMPDRGLQELIDVMAGPAFDDSALVLMGSGPIESELRAGVTARGAGDRVRFLPPVPPEDLLRWVASADVGIMVNQPRTLNERLSTPNKLFESLAAGLPVVSSNFPERRRIIVDDPDGPLGAVCDPTDPASIAAAIRSVLDLPRVEHAALRSRIAHAARARYAWDRQFGVALEVYGRVTGRRW